MSTSTDASISIAFIYNNITNIISKTVKALSEIKNYLDGFYDSAEPSTGLVDCADSLFHFL